AERVEYTPPALPPPPPPPPAVEPEALPEPYTAPAGPGASPSSDAEAPPGPSPASPAPAPPAATASSDLVYTFPSGQWVYIVDRGWVWVPADAATVEAEGVPYVYLYTAAFGWTWY